MESSNQLGNRITTQATEIGGEQIAAGTPITLCIGAANRDPAQFRDPDQMDSSAALIGIWLLVRAYISVWG